MQTFLPYEDFCSSAKVLDYRRLGKQRSEALIIYKNLLDPGGWFKHPAVQMWVNFKDCLAQYYNTILREWISRGYNNSMIEIPLSDPNPPKPSWLGCPDFHLSHQSNLVRKLPEHYRRYFPSIPNDLPYIWPRSN